MFGMRTSPSALRGTGGGAPSILSSRLALVMLMQHRTGVSDEQAMEAVAWDLRWKVVLGLPVDLRGGIRRR